jgi:hypothetical protein
MGASAAINAAPSNSENISTLAPRHVGAGPQNACLSLELEDNKNFEYAVSDNS